MPTIIYTIEYSNNYNMCQKQNKAKRFLYNNNEHELPVLVGISDASLGDCRVHDCDKDTSPEGSFNSF